VEILEYPRSDGGDDEDTLWAARLVADVAAADVDHALNAVLSSQLLDAERLQLLVDDVFGEPASATLVDPFCLNPNVVAVARTIYAECRFEDMPVLADALEEAGCKAQEFLDHCRDDGPHVRGCWLIDLIRNREPARQQ
jgi:hypothetical protein